MVKFPDKWIRKAIYDRIHNVDVSTNDVVRTIPCFDTRTVDYHGNEYVIMSTQTNVQTHSKCGDGWRSTILLEIFTRHEKNSGSRLIADDIIQEILTETEDLSLDTESQLVIQTMSFTTPNDITIETPTEIIQRKFIRFELLIN